MSKDTLAKVLAWGLVIGLAVFGLVLGGLPFAPG